MTLKLSSRAVSEINQLIENALQEDLGQGNSRGDHTSLACIPRNTLQKARLIIKDQGVLAGIEVAKLVFKSVDPTLCLEILLEEGGLGKVWRYCVDCNGKCAFNFDCREIGIKYYAAHERDCNSDPSGRL